MSQVEEGDGLWHAGEVRVQEKVFGAARAAELRRSYDGFVREAMPEEHQVFFEEAPWLVVGSLDPNGHPRASVVHLRDPSERQEDGKLFSTDDKQGETFSLAENAILADDPIATNLQQQEAKIGILGIQLHTRRRNRVNGTVTAQRDGRIHLRVMQSFGNCPKYIQTRRWVDASRDDTAAVKERLFQSSANADSASSPDRQGGIDEEALNLVRKADTFFIASGNHTNGVDVSHRGGPPGFVSIVDTKTLRFPDYQGNGFFNTLGNITVDPRVGLIFIDFEHGTLAQFQGEAEISFERDPTLPGSQRVVTVRISSVRVFPHALAIVAPEPPGMSPFLPSNASTAAAAHPVRVMRVMQQTPDTSTFYFASSRPVLYTPGQYGTFVVDMRGLASDEASEQEEDKIVHRCWTLSSTPPRNSAGESKFAITVKHQPNGRVSPLLHDMSVLPRLRFSLAGVDGNFSVPEPREEDASSGQCTTVFAAAGSGVTPVMSNVRRMATSGQTAVVFLSAKQAEEVIFMRELSAIASSRIHIHINLTRVADSAGVPDGAPPKLVFHAGRISSEVVALGLQGHEKVSGLFACGPAPFVDAFQSAYTTSEAPKPAEIVTESFSF
ncbi:NADH-cytochrome b5 reductase 2-A [Hondaea fermentalgiana]|uniref:NADH-cytochrome b5 reductase 2-A n=1 Tax=Hondaea fermentalgiana TaxID=2315210 RepID=A0A2R5GJ95_9STRA|nr:NADH-cytochrome b5 reductase 2-A [Hondaea fermentalgiana]|eukprot:GBG30957.1 NADH-cytochrome b5 reductase 2-A [Hondaea fermentalgiana]